jgi:hypothetical protein
MPLLEGTLITLKDKTTKKVEDLKINDELVTYTIDGLENIQNMEILQKKELSTFSGSFQESKIKNIWLDLAKQIYKINDSLLLDGSHYVYIKRNDTYYWSEIQYCLVGDELFKIDNTWEKINKIDTIKTKQNVYNVQMNRIYNYFANDYLVHNGAPCTACAACGEQESPDDGEGGGSGS